MDGSVWKGIQDIGPSLKKNIIDPAVKIFSQMGDELSNGIRDMVNIFIAMYDNAAGIINNIIGNLLPIIPPVGGKNQAKNGGGRAEGGPLTGANWVGEKGSELIIDGFVFPHDISMKLMDIFGGARGFAAGGSLGGDSGTSMIESMLNALAAAQQQLARSMNIGYGPMAPVVAGGSSSQDFSFYGTTIIQGNQQPGGLGDHLLNDRRY
jgi:hypothetical protein